MSTYLYCYSFPPISPQSLLMSNCINFPSWRSRTLRQQMNIDSFNVCRSYSITSASAEHRNNQITTAKYVKKKILEKWHRDSICVENFYSSEGPRSNYGAILKYEVDYSYMNIFYFITSMGESMQYLNCNIKTVCIRINTQLKELQTGAWLFVWFYWYTMWK